MKANTSVSLGPYFERFVEERIAEGRYKNASEVIRAGLRLLEREEEEYNKWAQWVTAELEKGEKSGVIENFDVEEFLAQMHAQADVKDRSNGRI